MVLIKFFSTLALIVPLLLLLVAVSSARDSNHHGVELATAQVEWLFTQGGFFHPNISIQPLFESEDESTNVPLGLFAKKDFKKGDTMIVVPRHCLLTAGPESMDMCLTATNLIKERRLKEQSKYAPYVDYLYSKDCIPLPSVWSDTAKKLIRNIRGEKLPPHDLTEVSFLNHCLEPQLHDADDTDIDLDIVESSTMQELEFAYLTVVSRAWTDKLVPVFDMLNHHSGRYNNVDSTPVHGSGAVAVHATRDIPAGEQLFLSYMDCIDEEGYENDYVLPQMLRDFGFVDAYPQRWNFPVFSSDHEEVDVVFDIDFVDPEAEALLQQGVIKTMPEMRIDWRTDPPTPSQVRQLEWELKRLTRLNSHVQKLARHLNNDYERQVIMDYYNSLTLALQYATGNPPSTGEDETCSSTANGTDCEDDETIVGSVSTDTTNVVTKTIPVAVTADNPGTSPEDWVACEDYELVEDEYENIEDFYSQYQGIDVFYNKTVDDACLYLDGYLHTCASNRAHYHEVFVHYPARFLDKVERVIFIGGGDSMVLHEVMKYNATLELVVGLELDQNVARKSFKAFGTQPHWDNDKVEWYFGDAAKSLLVLPKEYYGTFDLVIIDILTEVAKALRVNDELSVMEAAKLLMKPNGIIIKNEDTGYVPGTEPDYTKYSVDVVFHDVPLYCLQVFVAGSNTIDFLTAQPREHNVKTLYLKGLDDFRGHFDSWYNFGVTNSSETSALTCSSNTDDSRTATTAARAFGVLMILEAENIDMPLVSSAVVKSHISLVLQQKGLNEVHSSSSLISGGKDLEGFSIFVAMEEGHASSRCFPTTRYCAFDIQLFGEMIILLNSVKNELLKLVQSQDSSSYRFVTSGMFGKDFNTPEIIGPPSSREICEFTKENKAEETLPPGEQVRKERRKNDFGEPAFFKLHHYDPTYPLVQWQSQKQIGSQAMMEFQIPRFFPGEPVLVEYADGSVSEGKIAKYRGREMYAVTKKTDQTEIYLVRENSIKRLSEPVQKTLVSKFLTTTAKLILKEAKHVVKQSDIVKVTEVSDGFEGMMVAFSWGHGDVVCKWDGRSTISINIFVMDLAIDFAFSVDEVVSRNRATFTILMFDEFPRGSGRIVNFDHDMKDDRPIWA